MANEKGELFRKEALEQVSSPEQLDQLIQLVHLKAWLPLAAIGALVMIGLGWGIFGRIPTYVEAKGLLLTVEPAAQPAAQPPEQPPEQPAAQPPEQPVPSPELSLSELPPVPVPPIPGQPAPPSSPVAQSERPKLLSISYFPIAAGGKIQPGATALVIPTTANIQETGALKATITKISPTPVTEATLLNRIQGNQELANLVYTPAAIEVTAQLQPDQTTPTGYAWTVGSGSAIPLMTQTPTTVRIQLSEQAPIALLLPMLRKE
jgi:hypothetical protein